ncbi:MAG: GNAT family N-acetyltransferase [Planctomycetes bacterium]|nr:GNAT family N-acetyltransferase [Planctomycetota bacterium]
MNDIHVRAAQPDDAPTIVEFNRRLALESESIALQTATLAAGVAALLADGGKGRYFVACSNGRVVGQLMHTREWSDWRNGDIWWLQSVYVDADYRRRGVFRKLFEHLYGEARRDPTVVGLRLYVETHNRHARETYASLGMREAGYDVMEQFFNR